MKRFVLVLSLMAVMAMMLAATAAPAFAKQALKGEQGPPTFNTGNGKHSATVVHCNSDPSEGALAINKNNIGGQGSCL